MELEKRTMGSVDTSRTALAALAFAREVGKESSPGCAIWFGNSGTVNRMEPEGFKREPCYGEMLEWLLGGMQNPHLVTRGLSTGWAPESTWPPTGGSGLARAYCRGSGGTAAGNPELTGCFGTI